MAADRSSARRGPHYPARASDIEPSAPAPANAGRITAVLGPTNTGKTHFAMDRMLGHESGIIGFPLRLLARENYDRAVRAKGKHAVALVTGEEKIVPSGASHFICTVEAMPLGREAAFVAVDEVQLMADPARGHSFTDRVLNLRGTRETMFIGAETARPVLKRLVPGVEIVSRTRFSRLTWAGPKKITRLPPRSAVVAFTAADVYELAETVRRRRGGTAVVLGALSPRTRNAQVALYQEGDVDYLVATDAIGMGLNMDIDHVAFARIGKFDGRLKRRLSPAETGQIAGRAGRHMNDGTFGVTDGLAPLEPEEIEAVENHQFPPLRLAYWRNGHLDLTSLTALLDSLNAPPPVDVLHPAEAADDYRALAALAQDPDVQRLCRSPDQVALLWDVCQIPDFRKQLSDAHIRLVRRIYMGLANQGRVHEEWMAREVKRIDRADGEIGTLMGRIAEIRTWTYVAYRADWLADGAHWQQTTRDIEDKLSDSLHERLTERFVDRRTAVLVKRLREKDDLLGAIKADGEVLVEGVPVGRLEGFRFRRDDSVRGDDARAIVAAARRALGQDLALRVAALEDADDKDFDLAAEDDIRWLGARIGRLVKGKHVLAPRVAAVAEDMVAPELRARIEARLQAWLDGMLASAAPLHGAPPEGVGGSVRGLLFQLGEALGTLPRHKVADLIAGLGKADRRRLREMGVRLGRESVFAPALHQGRWPRLRCLLWAVWTGEPALPLATEKKGRVRPALDMSGQGDTAAWAAAGYRVFRGQAILPDRLERLSDAVFKLNSQAGKDGGFGPTPALLSLAGCDEDGLKRILQGIGYQWRDDGAGGVFERRTRKRPSRRKAAQGKNGGKGGSKGKGKPRKRTGRDGPNPDSPFAVLKELTGRR